MIRWIRDDRTLAIFPTSATPIIRGEEIANTLNIIRDYLDPAGTDTLEFTGKADFQYGLHVNLPPAIYRSPSLQNSYNPNSNSLLPGTALWTHANPLDAYGSKPDSTPGFVLPEGNITFENFYLHTSCFDSDEDGCLIGWSLETGTGTTGSASFLNCILDGSQNCDFTVYNWHAGSKTIDIRQSSIFYSRFGIAALSSTGSGTQTVRLEDVAGYGDADGSRSAEASSAINESSGGVLTLLCNRKGASTLLRCTALSTGIPAAYTAGSGGSYGVSRIASLFTNHYFSSAGATTWDIRECRSEITAGMETSNARNDYDLRGGLYTAVFDKNLGIGSSGDFKAYA